MRKPLFISAVVLVVIGTALTISFAGNRAVTSPTTLSVVEHPINEKVIDIGKPGDSSGDLLTFANELFDETNADKVGRDQGDCIRINTTEGSWECRWINFLKGGAITVEGPFFDSHDSVMAITGGRGKYKDARGSMELKALPDGSGYDFIFHVRS